VKLRLPKRLKSGLQASVATTCVPAYCDKRAGGAAVRFSARHSRHARWKLVEKELTGRETESWEIETAALMLGRDKSRSSCLEFICADFLAGANLDTAEPNVLLRAVIRVFQLLPAEQKHALLGYALTTAA
jgi:hypothetical protein